MILGILQINLVQVRVYALYVILKRYYFEWCCLCNQQEQTNRLQMLITSAKSIKIIVITIKVILLK